MSAVSCPSFSFVKILGQKQLWQDRFTCHNPRLCPSLLISHRGGSLHTWSGYVHTQEQGDVNASTQPADSNSLHSPPLKAQCVNSAIPQTYPQDKPSVRPSSQTTLVVETFTVNGRFSPALIIQLPVKSHTIFIFIISL